MSVSKCVVCDQMFVGNGSICNFCRGPAICESCGSIVSRQYIVGDICMACHRRTNVRKALRGRVAEFSLPVLAEDVTFDNFLKSSDGAILNYVAESLSQHNAIKVYFFLSDR